MQASQVYSELPPSLRKKLDAGRSGQHSKRKSTPLNDVKDLTGLVPVVSHESINTKLTQRPMTLVNPSKESDRRLAEKDVVKEQRRRQKIANRRRRSGRLVNSDLKPAVARAALSTSRSLLQGHISYELLLPLHALWIGYISELLNIQLRQAENAARSTSHEDVPVASGSGTHARPAEDKTLGNTDQSVKEIVGASAKQEEFTLSRIQSMQSKLVKADFHGCKVEVTRAKHPSLVGLAGIVAQETENTLRIVTQNNLVKVVPKGNVTFAFILPLPPNAEGKLRDLQFELNGSNFAFRGADRANKKFKAKGAKGLDY